MKYSRLSLAMIALLATQTVTQADDMDRDRNDKKPARTWRQAAYDNRYGLAAGSAAVGLGALGYVYGGDFMTWYNSLSSADQAKAQDVIEKSVEKDLKVIEEKQEVVAEKIDAKKHGVAQQKAIAREEQAIAQVQKQVAQKQTWLQYFSNMRANDPALQQIQAGIDAKNAEHAAENADYRSSDFGNSDRISDQEKDQYRNNQKYKNLKAWLEADRGSELEKKLRDKYVSPVQPAGPVNRVLGGDFSDVTNSEAYKNASTARQNLVDRMDAGIESGLNSASQVAQDTYNSAAQTASNAYNSVASYFTADPDRADQPNSMIDSSVNDTPTTLNGADVEGYSVSGRDGDRDESL